MNRLYFFNKKPKITLLVILGLIMLLIIIQIFNVTKVECSRNIELSAGFKNIDKVTFKIKKGKISNIVLNKKIEVADYYVEKNGVMDAVDQIMHNSYTYLDKKDYKINIGTNYAEVNLDINKNGIDIDNINIRANGNLSGSLYYGTNIELNTDSSYKIGDKYSKKALKEKLEKDQFTCK